MSLVSLSTYQGVVGTGDPIKQQFFLDAASQAVLNYTDRDFGTSNLTETRTYKYDGKGILEIDDCAAVHSVNGIAVPVFNWVAMREGPAAVTVYSWLRLPPMNVVSGEMGFSRNLDVFLQRYPSRPGVFLTDVAVNADFGWPTVPADVQQAVVFCAQEYERSAEEGTSGDLVGKTVAEVSEQFALQQLSGGGSLPIEGLPARVADILWPYKRHSL